MKPSVIGIITAVVTACVVSFFWYIELESEKELASRRSQPERPIIGVQAEVQSVGGCDSSANCGVTLLLFHELSCVTSRSDPKLVTRRHVMQYPHVVQKVCYVESME